MKHIIRGVLPPAKRMAKRLSTESADNFEEKILSAAKENKGSTPDADTDLSEESHQFSVEGSESNKRKMPTEHKNVSSLHKMDNLKSSCLGDSFKLSKHETAGSKVNNVKSNFTQLSPPVKSDNDKKEYRVIKLPNGLTALLISDVRHLIELDPEDYSLDEEIKDLDTAANEEDESESEFESDNESVSSVGTAGKSQMHEEKLAALALAVDVGSFSDPESIPGLAHFLEHMVFMGSEKFPQENDFDEYVKKQGGYDNACTYCEMTSFYFECHEKKLLRTMDKFAQFFISPLMKREAMTREREAIESEFQMSISSDDDRKAQLFSSMAVDKHPATKFTWGNLKTLRDNVTDDKLYEAVHNFRTRHYSAHRMTLAVQARLPLDILEKWVGECFSAIPNNGLPRDDFSPYKKGPAFNTEKFSKLYTVKPVKDVCQVEITWFMPSTLHLYKKRPTDYIAWFLGHEGRGSLISHLRKKVWALEAVAGSEEVDFENNSLYQLFTLSLVLTEDGMANLPSVIEAVFGYIKLLQSSGPQEWIFKEIQSIEEATFRFTQEVSAADYVESLAENMQKYPPEDYITGNVLYVEYDPEVITEYLNEFRVDNANIMLSTNSPQQGVTFNQTEPWFGTQYHVQDIPQEWIERWTNVKPYADMALPERNPFITTDFSILPDDPDTKDNIYPVKALDTGIIELWYKRDKKFLVPNAVVFAYFISPIYMESALTVVLLDTFILLLKHQIVEELYPSNTAGLECEVNSENRGWVVRCSGFNQKIPMLLETFIKAVKSFNKNIDDQMFAAVKDKIQKNYYNALIKPEKVAADVRASIIQQNYRSIVERHAAIQVVTTEMLRDFVDRYFGELYIQCLVQGNISKGDAIKLGENIVTTLDCRPLRLEAMPQKRTLEVPLGERVCRVRSFNKHDSNCITTNYYQSGKGTIKDSGIIDMLMMLMEEPLFNILRTQEQLGYHVYCIATNTYGIIGFAITVISQYDKFSVEHVDSRIEAFLKTFCEDLKKMKPDDFDQVLQSLIKIKNSSDVHMHEEVCRHWGEITSQEYVFDRRKRAIDFLKKLEAPTVEKWLSCHSICGNKSNLRKISIQVVGSNLKEKEKPESECLLSDEIAENLEFKFLPENDERPDYFIRDIQNFKKDLVVHPVHKLIS